MKDTHFFAINADIWWQEDESISLLQRLETSWDDASMDALLAIIPKEQAIEFSGAGDYHLKEESRLTFREEGRAAPYIFSGVRILHPRLFEGVSPGSFPQLLLFHKAEAKHRLHGVIHNNRWCDMGSFAAYHALEDHLRS
ncbi:hypothetical protein [Candidatus Paracaedibacter symbiosus]|uniref:hypothetical protein n=1 Tax=Candidatus Paracaedibacter symbiosus TaxID=244582 RepID=UPI000690FBE3|nr:hypothetical protein [Candidatus Paracaedibacter symbiosus]